MPPFDAPTPPVLRVEKRDECIPGPRPDHLCGSPQALAPRQAQAFRTLFSTEHAYDAGSAGFDGPCEPGADGGFAVHFDGRGSIPSVVLNGSDGEITVTGWEAIQQLSLAIGKAELMALRMAGVACASPAA